MANEILIAGIGDLIAAQIVMEEVLLLLKDRDTNILNHPALMYAGAASGSAVVRTAHLGLMGYDLLTSQTEGAAMSNTALTDGSTDITVSWYGKMYTSSDIARVVANGKIDPVLFARDSQISVARTLISLVANVADDFTNTVGASGVNMTFQNLIDAGTTLEVNEATGEMLAILAPVQWGDLKTDSLSLGGAPVRRPDAMSVVTSGTGQFKGNLFGIDIFTDSLVPTANAGADRAGAVFTRGAILWGDALFPQEGDPNIMVFGRGAFERDRTGAAGTTSYISHAFLGVSKGLDAAGVSVITDA